MNALVRTSVRNSDCAIVSTRLITPPPPAACRSSSVGRAMRTKMSCSDGFVISKCSTAVRCTSVAQERLRVAREAHDPGSCRGRSRDSMPGQRRRAPPRRPPCARGRCPARTAPGSRRAMPSSTLLPLKIMKMRSHSCSARRHVVRGEDDRRARRGAARARRRASASALTGSRPENGSSRISSCGFDDDRRDELDFLRHAFRQLVDALVGPVRQLQPAEPVLDGRVELGSGGP